MSEKLKSTKINGKQSTMNVLISGICLIVSALIGIFSININVTNESLETENTKLSEQNNDWEISYSNLQQQFDDLKSQNVSLSSEINDLKNNILQYSTSEIDNTTLKNENDSLKNEIAQLKNEKKELENKIKELEGGIIDPPSGKKVSIFDLDTFQGDGRWSVATSASWYTDTYDNEYTSAHFAPHYSMVKDEKSHVPTYLLDYKYSICEGQIAWSKSSKNLDGSVWIDFYSGDEIIYSTEPITATDRAITFSFSVDNVETLTIVKNSNRNSSWSYAYIIYPYLNLVE